MTDRNENNFFFWPILPEKKINEGITLQEAHLNNLMITRVRMKKGSEIPLHSHSNEQITMVVHGKIKFLFEDVEKIMGEGEGVKIPADTKHSAIAIEDCECWDSWSPIREDYIIEEKQ